ncbi:efflux RND transporter periplasmic adaptor subunit, partial [Moorena sp. SIO3H5]|uniref:efflux RND transporter periplasmic adaptor subunit n=1 Tax=Moorena sp. SIO3H5 TaxID=2607834 RepID=UPI0013BD94A4
PEQQIVLSAQTAGAVVSTQVDVGDPVQSGDVLAQIDSGLLTARVNEAQAELSVRQSEVAVDQVSITDAQAAAIQAQATRDQAKLDADRLRQLANQGAISQQVAEAAELTLISAEQAVASAQAQIEAREQAIAAANSRVTAQQAVLAEAKEQLRWVNVNAPQTATVLTKLLEPGDYVQPGTPIFELGNLSSLTIEVQVSELDIGQLALGQPAEIRFDAFPDIQVTGSVTRISPVADTTSRLIPVEVTLSNPDRRIGSGKLARVQFSTTDNQTVVVPASALKTGSNDNTVFILKKDEAQPTVTARSVTIGQQNQGNIEILSGLEPNETFIVASDRPLETDQVVRLSILSEVNTPEGQPE